MRLMNTGEMLAILDSAELLAESRPDLSPFIGGLIDLVADLVERNAQLSAEWLPNRTNIPAEGSLCEVAVKSAIDAFTPPWVSFARYERGGWTFIPERLCDDRIVYGWRYVSAPPLLGDGGIDERIKSLRHTIGAAHQ